MLATMSVMQCHAHVQTYVCVYKHTVYGYTASSGHQVSADTIIHSVMVYIIMYTWMALAESQQ